MHEKEKEARTQVLGCLGGTWKVGNVKLPPQQKQKQKQTSSLHMASIDMFWKEFDTEHTMLSCVLANFQLLGSIPLAWENAPCNGRLLLWSKAAVERYSYRMKTTFSSYALNAPFYNVFDRYPRKWEKCCFPNASHLALHGRIPYE